jgi:pimeloyl-ACP methyl ester carboxylesterase
MAETFVLLHGSWHGGWAWEPTAWCLRELGHEVYAPTYPGHQPGAPRAGIRHQDYVRSVVDFIDGRDLREVVLVGHSFGGSVVSRVSQEIPERLARLVFHTAFVVEDGASVNDNFPEDQTTAFAAAAAASPDNTVACQWEVFRDLFIHDASPEAARTVWERLVPQPFSSVGGEARPRRVSSRRAAAQLHRGGRRPGAAARDVAPADVVAAGRVQAGGDGRQPRGDVHAAGRARTGPR